MPNKSTNWDSDENQVKSNWVKFNVPMEDKIMGTLIAKRQIKSQIKDKENELVWVYDIKADEGSFHVLDEKEAVVPEPVLIESGAFYTVGGKETIDKQMLNVKVGQKVGMKFLDVKPSKNKGFKPHKNIRVYTPRNDDGSFVMDEEWIAENQVQNY